MTRPASHLATGQIDSPAADSTPLVPASRHPDAVIVQGGRPLAGAVPVAGFKHALVTLVAASVLADATVSIGNVPDIAETRVLSDILRHAGARIELDPDTRTLQIDCTGITDPDIYALQAIGIHGAIYLLPTFLARLGRASLGQVGGCQIGDRRWNGQRPVGHLIHVLERFGASFEQDSNGIRGRCSRLVGARVDLAEYAAPAPGDGKPTGQYYSGATKCALLAASAARGTSVLLNPYPKPDVTELVAALAAAGLGIEADEQRIVVAGTGRLPGGFERQLISDLIEAVTFMAASVHTGCPLKLVNLTTEPLRRALGPELELMARMGIEFDWTSSTLVTRRPERLAPISAVAASHSIFSDSQPFFTLMLTGADGPGSVTDTVWKDRLEYVAELERLGGRFSVCGPTVTVWPGRLREAGQRLVAADLRSAAVCLVAALTVPGATHISGLHHLDRGYEQLIDAFRGVGAEVVSA